MKHAGFTTIFIQFQAQRRKNPGSLPSGRVSPGDEDRCCDEEPEW